MIRDNKKINGISMKEVCISNEYNSEFNEYKKLYDTKKSLRELSDFIDLKSTQLQQNLRNSEKFIKKAEWLEEWTNKTPKDILAKASSSLSRLDNDKLDKLQKRIYRYKNYFNLLEQEEDYLKRCEYTFNFLTEIPAQINLYIEKYAKNEKFEAKPYKYIDKTEKASSLEMLFLSDKI